MRADIYITTRYPLQPNVVTKARAFQPKKGIIAWCLKVALLAVIITGSLDAGAQSSGCPTPTFAPAVNSNSGGRYPSSFALSDLNGDGKPDLAVTNFLSDNAAVLINNGNGTFATANSSPGEGQGWYSIITADFNRDGHPDLAVGDIYTERVFILLNDGNGAFTRRSSISNVGFILAVGDLNADGDPDLALATDLQSRINIFTGNGNGTFTAAGTYASGGTGPECIALNDLDGDDDLDIAIADGLAVGVLLNNGNGTFAPVVTYAGAFAGTDFIAVNDLNGDNAPDIVVSYLGFYSISVLLNNGNGVFTQGASYATGGRPNSVDIGDLNGDNKPDVAVGDTDNDKVWIFLNNGNGTFASGVSFALGGTGGVFVKIGDVNGDGKNDLVGSVARADKVAVFLNTCDPDGDGDGLPDRIDNCPSIANADQLDTNGDGQGNACDTDDDGDGDPDATDCAPLDASIGHNATEICNNIDDDCDGNIDEGVSTTFYQDSDGDGYGSALNSIKGCTAPTGYVSNNTDCDDTKASVYPGAVEVCVNSVDDNCNSQTDEGCSSIAVTLVPSFIIEGDHGKRPMRFIVALNKPAPGNVSVKYKTSNGDAKAGADYQKAEGTVSFSKGQWLKIITVNVYGDKQVEGNEKFEVQLHSPAGVKIYGTGKAKGTIINDDCRQHNAIAAAPEQNMKSAAEVQKKGVPEMQKLVVPNLLRRSQLWSIPNLPANNEVVVYDMRGRLIWRSANYSNNKAFSNVAAGIYFYNIIVRNKVNQNQVYKGKLMIGE